MYEIWTPIAPKGIVTRFEQLAAAYVSDELDVSFVANRGYTERVQRLLDHAKTGTKATSEPAYRMLQILTHLRGNLGGGRAVFRVSLAPAVGAAVAGLGNLLEDALQIGFAGLFYGVGAGLSGVGLIAFTVAIAVFGRGRRRLLAAVPAATLIGWSLFESGGGVLILVAWLAAAAMALDRPARTAAQTAPGSP